MQELNDIQLFEFDEKSHEKCVEYFRFIASVILVEKLFQNETDMESQQTLDNQKNILTIIHNHLCDSPESFTKENIERANVVSSQAKKIADNSTVHESVKQIVTMEKKENEIEYLQKRNEQLVKTMKILQKSVLHGHDRTEDLNSKIFTLQHENYKLKEHTEIQRMAFENVLDDRMKIRNDLSYEKKKIEEKLENETKEKENLGSAITQLQVDMDKLYELLSNRTDEIKDLNLRISEKVRIIEDSRSTIEDQHTTLQSERKTFNVELTQLKSENEELTQDVLSLENQRTSLSSQLEREARMRDGLEGQVSLLKQTLEDRDFINSQQQEMIRTLELQISERDNKIEEMSSENGKLGDRVKHLNVSNEEKCEKISNLESKSQDLEARVQKWVKIHDIDSRIKEKMKGRLNMKSELASKLEIEKKDLQDSISISNHRISELESEVKKFTSIRRELTNEKKEKLKHLEKTETLTTDLTNLRNRLSFTNEKHAQKLTQFHTIRLSQECKLETLRKRVEDLSLSQSKVRMDQEYFEKMYRHQITKTEESEASYLSLLGRYRDTLNKLSISKKETLILLEFKKRYDEWLMKKQQKPAKKRNKGNNHRNLLRKNKSLNRLYHNPVNKNNKKKRGQGKENSNKQKMEEWFDEINFPMYKKFHGAVKYTSFGGNNVVDPTNLQKMGWNL